MLLCILGHRRTHIILTLAIVLTFRYCYLRQEVDGTYILELHKDEKQGDAKATIVMDFCNEVAQVGFRTQIW